MFRRILFITDIHKNLSGGIKQLYYNIVGLKNRGYKVYLVCKKNAKVLEIVKNNLDDLFYLEFENYKTEGEKLLDFIKLHNIDVVHTFHNKGHKVGLWAKIHGGKFKLFVNRGVSFTPTNLFYYPNPKIDGFICNSKIVADKLKYIFVPKRKRNVIYNSFEVNTGDFHTNTLLSNINEKSNIKIATICNEAKWKGLDLTLKALSKLNEDFSFYLIGIDEIVKFKNLVTPELKNKMEILGRRKDIIPLLSKMDIFIYTPRDGDSCPNVVLEAMYAGLPVVGTNVGGIPELIVDGKGGFVVKKYNKINEKIELLLKNRSLRKSMGEFNKKRMSFFNIDRKIDNLLKVYDGKNIVEEIY